MMSFHAECINLYHVLCLPVGWQVTPASLLCWQSLVVASKLHFKSSLSTLGLQPTLFITIGPVPCPKAAPVRAMASAWKKK